MLKLSLSLEEEQVLKQVLRHALSDLDLEILHTDTAVFKAMLRKRREIVRRLHDRLPERLEVAA